MKYQQPGLSESYPVLNHPGIIIFREDFDNISTVPFAYLTNKNQKNNVTMVLLIRGYDEKHPIPGYFNNCSSNNELKIEYSMDSITLEFLPARLTSSNEGTPILTYSIYQHYLSERNFEMDTFLAQLTNRYDYFVISRYFSTCCLTC